MTRHVGFASSGLLCVALGACSATSEPRPHDQRVLERGVIANVDGAPISAESVLRVAQAQNVTVERALALLVSDALFSREAHALASSGVTSSIERAALARALLERVERAAAERGVPSEAEAAAVLRELWTELDRPDAAVTTHAVALFEPDPSGKATPNSERVAKAEALARRVLDAVRDATSADDFIARANAIAKQGGMDSELRAQKLQPVTADGRTFIEQGEWRTPKPAEEFDADFARAALALQKPGELSPIVKTRFGFHVIRLERRIPGHALEPAERDARIARETYARRAAGERQRLLERLRGASAVEVDRAASELTGRVRVAP
jgi:hypothetical protein